MGDGRTQCHGCQCCPRRYGSTTLCPGQIWHCPGYRNPCEARLKRFLQPALPDMAGAGVQPALPDMAAVDDMVDGMIDDMVDDK